MAIEITKPGKNSLVVETPVMPAAGVFGFSNTYRELINIEKLGALVTNPITYQAWRPATGTRVVPLDSGMLVHTGLPNRGLHKTLDQYRDHWTGLPLPIIVHLVATSVDQVRRGAEILDRESSVDAVELGLYDDIGYEETRDYVRSIATRMEKPVLVRLPFMYADDLAEVAAESGADALVVAAPPRGTARDPITQKLVSGRLYGPLVKPMALRMVGQIARRVEVPVIGAGGIHSPQDARDFLEAGARAVQVDSVTWLQPTVLEVIARDLGGWVVTRATGAFPDEWHPGMGETERQARQRSRRDAPAEDPP